MKSNTRNPGLALVRPQGPIGKWFDMKMEPTMYRLQGNRTELPQRTHFWNNFHFALKDHLWLKKELMASVMYDPKAVKRRRFGIVPIFHMPKSGGWQKYVVLEPENLPEGSIWFIGWIPGDGSPGLSMIPLTGSDVRCLRGDSDTLFFAILSNGEQLKLRATGYSQIGECGVFSQIPFL